MSQWDLPLFLESSQTAAMRLPQSSRRPLSLFTVSLIIIAVSAALPLQSQTGAPSLAFSPQNLRFGGVPTGKSEMQTVVLSNSGQTSATISAISASDSVFSVSGASLPLSLSPGGSAVLNVTFAPTALGGVPGAITFSNNTATPTLSLPVVGSGFQGYPVDATPSSLSFGQVTVGSSASLSVVLTNTLPWNKVVTGLVAIGTGIVVSGPDMPATLAPEQSITLKVTFRPRAAGMVAGRIFVNGPALSIPLSGIGATVSTVGQLNIAPVGMNFGSVDIGASSNQTLTMSATGGSVTVNSAASSNAQFSMPGVTFPMTINAGSSAQVNVAFAPTSSGTDAGIMTFASNASNSNASESMTGNGVALQYDVNLSWVPSTSSVAGYNVYRGSAVGSYSKINTSLDPSTAYSDNTVASGNTYFYAATAVNSSGEESGYSTPIKVAIP